MRDQEGTDLTRKKGSPEADIGNNVARYIRLWRALNLRVRHLDLHVRSLRFFDEEKYNDNSGWIGRGGS